MKKYRPNQLIVVGENLRTLREELGYTLRDAGRLLDIDHAAIYHHEQKGFQEPQWTRYIDIYGMHPDLKQSVYPVMEIGMGNLFARSKLYQDLMSIYGRDKLYEELEGRTNREVIEDLREKVKAWEWAEFDIDCMRRRVGFIIDRD